MFSKVQKQLLNILRIQQLKKLLFFALLISQIYASAQKTWFLKFDISVISREIKLPGATISVSKDGSDFETVTVGNDAKHVFELPQDGEYSITITKPGYESKIFLVSTNNVPEKQVLDYYFNFRIAVDIHKILDGIDYSILDEPMAKLYYDRKPRIFTYNYKYTQTIENALQKLRRTVR